ARPARRHPLRFAGGGARIPAWLPGGDGAERGRRDHGAQASRAAGHGGPVPSRSGADRERPCAAGQFPRPGPRRGGGVIFLGDRLGGSGAARIDAADRGFTLGDGVFETLRAYDGRPFRLDAHLARLAAGAETLGFAPPLPPARIAAAVAETLAANRLESGDAAIRITLSRGTGARGLLP